MELKPSQQPVLPATPTPHAAVQVRSNSGGISLLHAAGISFLTFNSYMAIKRSIDDPWNVAFVVSSYLDLLLLFFCLHIFEKTPEDSPKRGPLKVAVWSLSSVLTVMFSYKVAAIMPLVMKVVVWLMSGSTVGAGFYAFFIYRDDIGQTHPSKGAPKEMGANYHDCPACQADLV